jgi:hypothetical protein
VSTADSFRAQFRLRGSNGFVPDRMSGDRLISVTREESGSHVSTGYSVEETIGLDAAKVAKSCGEIGRD